MNYRKGEEQKTRFRTDRCFRVEGDWFIATREGQNIGPFESRSAAESGVIRYLDYLKKWQEKGASAEKVALSGVWATNLYF